MEKLINCTWRMIRNIGLFIVMCCFVNCFTTNRFDLYDYYPRGTVADSAMIAKAEQIVRLGNSTGLLVNVSPDPDDIEYHVLVFDEQLNLQMGFYLSRMGISDISQDTIYAFKSPVYEQKAPGRVMDIPSGYHLELIDVGSSFRSIRNKVLTTARLLEKEGDVTLRLGFQKGEKQYYQTSTAVQESALSVIDTTDIRPVNVHFSESSIYTCIWDEDSRNIVFEHYMFEGATDRAYLEQLVMNALGLR